MVPVTSPLLKNGADPPALHDDCLPLPPPALISFAISRSAIGLVPRDSSELFGRTADEKLRLGQEVNRPGFVGSIVLSYGASVDENHGRACTEILVMELGRMRALDSEARHEIYFAAADIQTPPNEAA